MKDTVHDKDQELWTVLYHTSHIITKARQKELRHYNISGNHSFILWAAQLLGERAIPSQISRMMFQGRSAVSGILKRMEKEGLVERLRSLKRKNTLRVVITEKGYDLYGKASKRESIHRVFSPLSEEEHQQLTLLLQKVQNSAIDELYGPAADKYRE